MEFLLTALIFIAAAAIVVLAAKHVASHEFKCKHCSTTFHIKMSRAVLAEHSGDSYKLVCPHCSTKDWCMEQTKT